MGDLHGSSVLGAVLERSNRNWPLEIVRQEYGFQGRQRVHESAESGS